MPVKREDAGVPPVVSSWKEYQHFILGALSRALLRPPRREQPGPWPEPGCVTPERRSSSDAAIATSSSLRFSSASGAFAPGLGG